MRIPFPVDLFFSGTGTVSFGGKEPARFRDARQEEKSGLCRKCKTHRNDFEERVDPSLGAHSLPRLVDAVDEFGRQTEHEGEHLGGVVTILVVLGRFLVLRQPLDEKGEERGFRREEGGSDGRREGDEVLNQACAYVPVSLLEKGCKGERREGVRTESVKESGPFAFVLLVQALQLRHHEVDHSRLDQPVQQSLERLPLLLSRVAVPIFIIIVVVVLRILEIFRVEQLFEDLDDGDGDVDILVREQVGEGVGGRVFEQEGVGQGRFGRKEEEGPEGFEQVELGVDESEWWAMNSAGKWRSDCGAENKVRGEGVLRGKALARAGAKKETRLETGRS